MKKILTLCVILCATALVAQESVSARDRCAVFGKENVITSEGYAEILAQRTNADTPVRPAPGTVVTMTEKEYITSLHALAVHLFQEAERDLVYADDILRRTQETLRASEGVRKRLDAARTRGDISAADAASVNEELAPTQREARIQRDDAEAARSAAASRREVLRDALAATEIYLRLATEDVVKVRVCDETK